MFTDLRKSLITFREQVFFSFKVFAKKSLKRFKLYQKDIHSNDQIIDKFIKEVITRNPSRIYRFLKFESFLRKTDHTLFNYTNKEQTVLYS